MRAVKLDFLEMYRKTELKKYSQILNLFFRKKWSYLLLVLFVSCGAQYDIDRDNFKRVPKECRVSFYDKLDTIKNQNDARFFTRSLLKDFSNREDINYSKPITMEIKNNELFIQFETTDQKRYVLQFFGKHQRRKFVFYTNYETISFPLIFIRKEMARYTIQLPSENELLFDTNHVNEGMFLMLGAGHSYGSGYKFKLIKNE